MEATPKRNNGDPGDTWVVVATIIRPRGNKGELSAAIETDWPEERYQPGEAWIRNPEGEVAAYVVESTWFHKGRVVIKLAGVDDISGAERFRGHEWVVSEEDRLALPEGAYYRDQLLDLEAVDRDGNPIGRVRSLIPSGAQDLLVLDLEGREVLVPYAPEYILEVDLEGGRLVVHLPEELKELNR